MEEDRSNVRKIVVSGVMSSIIILLGITHLGFIPWFSGASLTVMHVPVIIAAILEGPIVGLITGFIFGIFSLIQAAVAPTGPIDVYFTNPLISVLPRIMIGLMTWLSYKAFRGRLELPAVITAALVGSLTNTVLVLTMLAVVGAIPWTIILGILVTNGLPEAGASATLSAVVVLSWKGMDGSKKGSSLDDLED